MGKLHRIVGAVGVVAFLLTGAYMRLYFPGMQGVGETTRLIMRSRHIYLLLGSLINLGVGIYYQRAPAGWRRWLQTIASILVVVAPPLLLAAFIDEPRRGMLEGQLARMALYGLLGGVLFQAVCSRRESFDVH